MENLEVTINLPNLRLNIPEESLNFHYLERIIFDLTRKIGVKAIINSIGNARENSLVISIK